MTPEGPAEGQGSVQGEQKELPVPEQRMVPDEPTALLGLSEPSGAGLNSAGQRADVEVEQVADAELQLDSSLPGKSKAASARNSNPIEGFSPAASTLYAGLVSRYIVDLERFSRFKAKSGSLEGVSKQHVAEAGAFLSSSRVPPKKLRYCETAGGILLGAGVSELITLMQAKTLSARLVIITVLLIAVGGVMIGMFLGRE
jgi:hypothetical protein